MDPRLRGNDESGRDAPVRDTVRIGTPQRAGVSISPMCINGNGMGLDPSMK